MRISVVIPTINEAANVGTAIASCWAAGANEVIIADGGSTDTTVETARQLQCQVVISGPGRGVQQNEGAAVANGDYLVFLHADCLFDPRCLLQLRQLAMRTPHCFGGFQQTIPKSAWAYRLLEHGNSTRTKVAGLIYGDQGLFLSKDLFQRAGGFPAEPLMEDVVMSRRLSRFGRPHILPGPLSISPRRWEHHGIIRQTLRNWTLLSAFFLGVPPQRLARHYRRHDEARSPKAGPKTDESGEP